MANWLVVALRYYHTLRYLKPVQLYGRIWHQWHKPKLRLGLATPKRRVANGSWKTPAVRCPSMCGPLTFRLLNEEGRIALAEHWNDAKRTKLWLYHLHYFDDLSARDARVRHSWHLELIERWLADNLPGKGCGWEPYPLSRRIVNWIKWELAGNRLSAAASASLAYQVRWLEGRLENHLLGNHLFTNAKALLYAGLFFTGSEARRWQRVAWQILQREVREQILADGGHFERSPMYHALVLEDLLDLLNLCTVYRSALSDKQCKVVAAWQQCIGVMRHWLAAMCHPDGEIAFFNDTAMGVAPTPAELDAYALRCGLSPLPALTAAVTHLASSGYIRIQLANCVAIIDVAPIGPDYLPGHAHADTLSFELSLKQQRLVVNSGVSCYGLGEERLRQRGTAAHSTVVVDNQDSSEVWSGFRVARRARPLGLSIDIRDGRIVVRCGHDGYRRLTGKPVHWRTWEFCAGSLTIQDVVQGGRYGAKAYYHFWPGAMSVRQGMVACADQQLSLVYDRQAARWITTSFHKEFGFSIANSCLVLPLSPSSTTLQIKW